MNFPGKSGAIGDPETCHAPTKNACRFPRFSRPVGSSSAGDAHTSAGAHPTESTRMTAAVMVSEAEKLAALLPSPSPKEPGGSGTDDLAAVLRAAWAVLLRCYTGQDDVGFAFCPCGDDPCSGRGELLAARFAFGHPTAVSDLVGGAKTETTAGTEAGVFDTAVIVTNSTPRGNVQNLVRTVTRLKKFGGADLQHANLCLVARCGEATVDLALEWDESVLGMSRGRGVLVADSFGEILSCLLASEPDTPVDALSLVGRANLEQVQRWNESVSTATVERCIHHVIADTASKIPDAEAVCSWDGSLTYRELQAASSALAARLVQLGVGPEVLVPLCFEKSVGGLPP